MLTLTEFMEQKGYTQTRMAKLLRCSRAHVSRLESGERMPSFEMLRLIKKVSGGLVTDDSFDKSKKNGRRAA